jgi:hypothetical protein
LFEAGDFLSVNGDQISFVHRETLQPFVFTAGSWVRPEPPAPKQSAPKPHVPGKPANHPKPAQLIRATKTRNTARGEKSGYDMTKAEMVHFDNKRVALADLFRKLEPVIKKYAREGTRKPKDVTLRLNADGFRTADGAKWTPRLVYFLLALMFNDTPSPKNHEPETAAQKRAANGRPPAPAKSESSPLSLDEIAARLSRLGKVVRN